MVSMRLRLLLTPALLLLVAGRAEIDAGRVEALRELAADATKAGFHSLARRCAADASRIDPKTERIEAADEADSPRLSDRRRARLLDEYREIRARAAADLAELAADVGGEEGRALAREAVRLDRENGDARRLLGRERVDGFGWVPAEDAKRYRKGLLPLDGEWRPRKAVERVRRDWDRAFVVESDFWRIRSNLPLRRIFELRDLLDALHVKWTEDWAGHLPLREGDHGHDVLIFAKKGEYEGHLEATDPRRIRGVPGQYSPTKRRAAFFDVETLGGGGTVTSTLEELMQHECTHQLVHEDVVGRPENLEGAEAPNFWLHEGLAELYGMHTERRGRLVLDRSAIRKMLRTAYLKRNARRMLPIPELDRIGRRAFLGSDMEDRRIRYAQAGFFAMFLLEGKREGAFRRLVREVYCGENRAGLISGTTGEDAKALDRAFRRFLRSL